MGPITILADFLICYYKKKENSARTVFVCRPIFSARIALCSWAVQPLSGPDTARVGPRGTAACVFCSVHLRAVCWRPPVQAPLSSPRLPPPRPRARPCVQPPAPSSIDPRPSRMEASAAGDGGGGSAATRSSPAAVQATNDDAAASKL
jgi:hypothetical protein